MWVHGQVKVCHPSKCAKNFERCFGPQTNHIGATWYQSRVLYTSNCENAHGACACVSLPLQKSDPYILKTRTRFSIFIFVTKRLIFQDIPGHSRIFQTGFIFQDIPGLISFYRISRTHMHPTAENSKLKSACV